MNCINCGGKLIYKDNVYICENCGTKQQIETFFENIDVFICYVEADEHGRRTKDSVIAQDIYNKLQSSKINTFYQRISADTLNAEDLRKAQYAAMLKSKVVIVCAASKENFNRLLDENRDNFTDKNIIPVYSSINAYDIPEELAKLQAVNYDNIGAITDLTKNLLRLLGREMKADATNIANEQMQRKRKRKIISIFSVLLILILTLIYIVFGTPYVLKSKKYSYAEKLMSNGQYLEAVNIFAALENYENASDMVKKIYDRYDGYYTSEENVSLYLNIENGSYAEFEITKIYDNKTVKVNTSAKNSNNVIDFHYRDSEKNQGEGKIELYNDGIKLIIKTEKNTNNLTIGNYELYFNLKDKSDSPLFTPVKGTDLIAWLEKQVSADYIRQLGYELEYIETGWQDGGQLYEIKNTNIQMIIAYYNYPSEDTKLYSFSAPASLILPEQIGKKGDIVVKDDIIYIPFGELEGYGPKRSQTYTGETVESNTMIAVTSKTILNSFGEFSWPLENLIGREFDFIAKQNYGKYMEGSYSALPVFQAENDNYYLYTLDIDNVDFFPIYKISKENYHFEFIGEMTGYREGEPYYTTKINWDEYPELLEEFDLKYEYSF